jgi:hypothetical protein
MKYLAPALLVSALSVSAATQAADLQGIPHWSLSATDTPTGGWTLAQNDAPADRPAKKARDPKTLHVDFEEPTFTGEKMHQYLGLATLGLVALTAISPKEEDGPHELFGTAAAVTAGATVGTGLVYHWEDFKLSDGVTEPDNLHLILGSLGALMMAAAIGQAPEGGHAGLGIGGGALMATAVKITW